ncbi:MAG TPA: putative molybdenum carrier protein [Methylomirabilota bacterium]|nr:putative molybdenum carrier protein [Methylomirabilota bacterium]
MQPTPKTLKHLPKGFTIISGGQTGADRAALDWAMEHGIPVSGWCPKYRLAEDGCVPAKYPLKEMDSPSYSERTEQNVRDSDATLLISLSPELTGGSKMTLQFAKQWSKPVLHVSKADLFPGVLLREFLRSNKARRLNVAGPRASTEPQVARFVQEVLDALLNAGL